METKWIAIALALAVLLGTVAFAVSNQHSNSSEADIMDAMHEQMMKNVQDPVLRQAMDNMHERHMQEIENSEGAEMHSHVGTGEEHAMMHEMMGMR